MPIGLPDIQSLSPTKPPVELSEIPEFNQRLITTTLAFLTRPSLRSEHSRRQYLAALKDTLGTLSIDLTSISPQELCDALSKSRLSVYLDKLGREGRRPATVRHRLHILRGWLEDLVDEDLLPKNSLRRVQVPLKPEDRAPARVLTPDEIHRLFQVMPKPGAGGPEPHLRDLRDRALLFLGLALGLRRNELVNLKEGDIDRSLTPPTLRYVAKGNRRQRRALRPDVLEAIDEYLARRGPRAKRHPLFSSHRPGARSARDEKPLTGPDVYRILTRWADLADIDQRKHDGDLHGLQPRVSPQSLRATHITMALEVAPLTTVQRWVGHASPVTTASYNRPELEVADDPTLSLPLPLYP